MMESLSFLARGGPVVVLIGILSVIALALFVERWLYLQRRLIVPPRFMQVLLGHLQAGRLTEARALCDQGESTAAVIAGAGLADLTADHEEAAELMAERGRRELASMERFTGALGVIAAISPLLGLLGTITGMIATFQQVDVSLTETGQISPGALASGIWEALITTAAGLSVAIPAFLGTRFLLSRIDAYTLELEELSSSVVRALRAHRTLPRSKEEDAAGADTAPISPTPSAVTEVEDAP